MRSRIRRRSGPRGTIENIQSSTRLSSHKMKRSRRRRNPLTEWLTGAPHLSRRVIMSVPRPHELRDAKQHQPRGDDEVAAQDTHPDPTH
jgi:hypothetical protein